MWIKFKIKMCILRWAIEDYNQEVVGWLETEPVQPIAQEDTVI